MFYLLQTFSLSITESSFHSFAFPSEKDNPSKSGEIYTHIKHSENSCNVQVKQMLVDFGKKKIGNVPRIHCQASDAMLHFFG